MRVKVVDIVDANTAHSIGMKRSNALNVERGSKCWTLKIADIPPSLNALFNMHWAKRNNVKQMWRQWIQIEAKRQALPKISGPIQIGVTFFVKKHLKQIDPDNLSVKPIFDGLVPQVLDGDSAEVIKEIRIRIEKAKKSKTILTICQSH